MKTIKDHRTGLSVIKDIPPEFRNFAALKDAALFWIGHVDLYDENWQSERLMATIATEAFYICDQHTNMRRAIWFGSLQEVICSGKADCALIVPEEFDCFFSFTSEKERSQALRIIRTMKEKLIGVKLPVKEDHGLRKGDPIPYGIAEPEGWLMDAAYLMSKKKLKKINDQASGKKTHPKQHHRRSEYPQDNNTSHLLEEFGKKDRQLDEYREQVNILIAEQNTELDSIREKFIEYRKNTQEKFLEYDRGIVDYLNTVYSAFPDVLNTVGMPPNFGSLSGVTIPRTVTEHSPKYESSTAVQKLSEENAKLRETIAGLMKQINQPTLSPHSPASPWGPASPSGSRQRVPAAEARRNFRPSVSGGMGPGGQSRRNFSSHSPAQASPQQGRLNF
eukprot:TRINITY_DN1212_c1_g1_i1.p1 TRINITY_DN1212_c1_g1~~TRINITY_DN1212_c1_g1_i1.p1  ORF type:complete len:391 (+),score=58.48 TRINITY_DN1212_c1_g1_i1:67-1239(+)